MPCTFKDFVQDWIKEHADQIIAKIAPERRVKGPSPEVLEQLLKELRDAESAKTKPSKKPKGRTKPDTE